jgi:hypothetical protein
VQACQSANIRPVLGVDLSYVPRCHIQGSIDPLMTP